MKRQRHKLRITPETLAAFKAARVRELERQGRPVPATLLPSPTGTTTRGQRRLRFETTEATR